jgi:hypothetical protein
MCTKGQMARPLKVRLNKTLNGKEVKPRRLQVTREHFLHSRYRDDVQSFGVSRTDISDSPITAFPPWNILISTDRTELAVH